MESGAKGCEVVVSGKLRAARAKSMKFTDGFMIHSGQPAEDFVDYAVRHVMLRQGVLGIKVKMYAKLKSCDPVHDTDCSRSFSMKGWDPEGQLGPRKPLPDSVQILEPPLDKIVAEPTSEQREPAVAAAPAPAAEEPAYAPQEGFQQTFEQPAAF